MEIIGLIAEYNPLHNGHLYHINKIKEKYPNSLLVLVLNGYFLQRGEVSIISKYDKTLLALEYGVDIVISLPTLYGVQSADTFADTSIKLLNYLKVSRIIFGSETNDIDKLTLLAKKSLELDESEDLKETLKSGINYPTALSKVINESFTYNSNDLLGICYIKSIIKNNFNIKTIDSLDKFFESLFNEKEKTENGIVFTPDFIADYIVKNTIINFNKKTKIIDPSCGCGIFLISTIKHIKSLTNISISNIIKNNLFGIDLQKENIERVKILISLYAIINGEDNEEYKFNLKCCDSLFNDWERIFNVNKFDYIIGNPPYINNHDLKDEYINLLKSNFETTQEGIFNIFYAFIEKSSIYLSDTGKIGYIIPNNFLHIKSAKKLRQYIKNNNLLNTIIDFKDNTVFSPVLTYNSIIFLTKNNTTIKYSQIKKTKNVNSILENINFKIKKINELDDDGWILSNNNVINNIRKIESYNKIDPFIKTGIATLRDKLFILDGYNEEKNF